MTPFWSGLLSLFAARYAMPPAAFWRLSVIEAEALLYALTATEKPAVPDRNDFKRLLGQFPDAPGNIQRAKQ